MFFIQRYLFAQWPCLDKLTDRHKKRGNMGTAFSPKTSGTIEMALNKSHKGLLELCHILS
jgi:hypothetical protein